MLTTVRVFVVVDAELCEPENSRIPEASPTTNATIIAKTATEVVIADFICLANIS